jgi:hypothetical protein
VRRLPAQSGVPRPVPRPVPNLKFVKALSLALAHDSGLTQDLRVRVSQEQKRRPVRRTNPAPWRFQMARVTSQSEDQGADSSPFAAGFDAFPLRVGVLDLAESTAWGSARRIGATLCI